MKKIACMFLMTALFALLARPVCAEKTDPKDLPWETAYLNFGYYLVNLNSSFRIGADNLGLGVDINVEDFLGLDSSDTAFRIDAGYRFGKSRRHVVEFSWFNFDREATQFIEEEITIPPELGGGTIPANVTIQSFFNFDIARLKYRYSIFLDDRIDLNLGLGVYVMPIEFGIEQVGSTKVMEEDITAPLPVFALGFDLALTPQWYLRQAFEMFYLEIGNFEGGILNSRFAVEYLPWKHVGLGAGLDGLFVDIEATGDTSYPGIDFIGSVKFSYFGAQLYVKFYY